MSYDYDNRTAAKGKKKDADLLITSAERTDILKQVSEAQWQMKEIWIRADREPHKGTAKAKKVDEAKELLDKVADMIRAL